MTDIGGVVVMPLSTRIPYPGAALDGPSANGTCIVFLQPPNDALLVEHVFAGQNNTSGSDFEVIETNGAMRLPFRFERLLVHGLSIER